MRYFKIEEFRCRCGCCMPAEVKENVTALVDRVLDPVRAKFGWPIVVNSGYRCPARNRAVGGAVRSQHLKGEAADICAGLRSNGGTGSISTEEWRNRNLQIARLIKESGNYDQLILEDCDAAGRPRWVHVSM
ncbi:MAG: peptidase M15 [Bacteroidaceae bacterium]|nr:peptidase M15 [Bacteroidaceae bacterium]